MKSPKYKVVVTDDRFGVYTQEKKIFEDMDVELIIADCVTPGDVIEACEDADGVLVCMAPMPDEAVRRLKKCRVICKYGVGIDNIDVEACTDRGITVCNVPDYAAEEVSDHALALLMACARKTTWRDVQVREGQWDIFQADPVYRISGKKFTFLGFGQIARCLNRKISGFGFSRIMVYDPYVDEETIQSLGAEKVEWEEAIREADFISVHMMLNEQTRGMINADTFEMMKPTVILVNTARGAVVDETALIDALKRKRINSAGLDVYQIEPIEMDNPLKSIENCVLTDHMSWYSEESITDLQRKAAMNVRDVLLDKEPRYLVNQLHPK